jgi:hypothetical protein
MDSNSSDDNSSCKDAAKLMKCAAGMFGKLLHELAEMERAQGHHFLPGQDQPPPKSCSSSSSSLDDVFLCPVRFVALAEQVIPKLLAGIGLPPIAMRYSI